jgi:hypothetical protein
MDKKLERKIEDTNDELIFEQMMVRGRIKGTVSQDAGRDETMEWLFSPKLRFAKPFFSVYKSAVLKLRSIE